MKELINCLSFTYDAQLWSQTNKESQNKIHVIQKWSLRKISFRKLHDHIAQLYKDLKLLKFCDIAHWLNCLFMNQIKQNKKLAKSFSELKYCGHNHNYQTRSMKRILLDIPYVKKDAYETQSAKYCCIIDRNNFKKTFLNLSPDKHGNTKLKALLKKHFFTINDPH